MFDHTPEQNVFMPVYSMQPTAECVSLGIEDWPLDLLVSKLDWFNLPNDLKAEFLDHHAHKILCGYTPYWAVSFQLLKKMADPLMFDRLGLEEKRRVWEILKPDVSNFLTRYPDYSKIWGGVEDKFLTESDQV